MDDDWDTIFAGYYLSEDHQREQEERQERYDAGEMVTLEQHKSNYEYYYKGKPWSYKVKHLGFIDALFLTLSCG